MVDFQPLTKRFMVWDTKTRSFCESKNNTNGVFDLIELATFIILHAETGRPHTDFVFIQSTNLFDKDGNEIFEGSILEDESSGLRWLVFIEHGAVMIRHGGAVMHYGYISSPMVSCPTASKEYKETNTKLVGHILSNSELMEEKNV